MGKKRFAEEGQSLDGDRPGKLLHGVVGIEVENQPSNGSIVSPSPPSVSVDARKQAMIAAAMARERAHKQKMTLSKRKKTSTVKHPPSTLQQASHVPLSEQAKKAAELAKADEGTHAAQLGYNPYETCQMTSGQARSATVAKKHGTIQKRGEKSTSKNAKDSSTVVSKNAFSPPAFLPPSVSREFENAYTTLMVASNDATATKSSIAIMCKLIVNATTKGQDLTTEDSSKFRKVRLSNEKIKAAITQVNGGLDIMQAVGFQLAEDNGETYLVYPPGESGPDWLPESLEAMQQYGGTMS